MPTRAAAVKTTPSSSVVCVLRRMMEIVELSDRGDSGIAHFAERLFAKPRKRRASRRFHETRTWLHARSRSFQSPRGSARHDHEDHAGKHGMGVHKSRHERGVPESRCVGTRASRPTSPIRPSTIHHDLHPGLECVASPSPVSLDDLRRVVTARARPSTPSGPCSRIGSRMPCASRGGDGARRSPRPRGARRRCPDRW